MSKYCLTQDDYLKHHGILGQRWGKLNGPPYPLGSGDHSARERKEGYTKSKLGKHNDHLYDRNDKKYYQEEKKNKKIISDKEREEYKNEMLKRYRLSDRKRYNFYKNATKEEFEKPESFVGFDFENTWKMEENGNLLIVVLRFLL